MPGGTTSMSGSRATLRRWKGGTPPAPPAVKAARRGLSGKGATCSQIRASTVATVVNTGRFDAFTVATVVSTGRFDAFTVAAVVSTGRFDAFTVATVVSTARFDAFTVATVVSTARSEP